MKPILANQVAIVAGASRGLGKGIALALSKAGATTYVTGRTVRRSIFTQSGNIEQTVDEITSVGGKAIAIKCDHRDYSQVSQLFSRIRREQGRIDILVNSLYPTPELSTNIPRSLSGRTPRDMPFWKLPLSYWDDLMLGSLRAQYLTSVLAAETMAEQRRGLIIYLSSHGAERYWFNAIYSLEKSAVEALALFTSFDLVSHNVTTMAIRVPLSKTEAVIEGARKSGANLSEAQSPLFTGEVIVSLAQEKSILRRSGGVYDALALGKEFGILVS